MAASKISPKNFYSTTREKTHLNWFCYEFAFNLEQELSDLIRELPRPKFVRASEVPAFAIYVAKQVREEYLRTLAKLITPATSRWGKKKLRSNSRSKEKSHAIKVYPEWVEDYFPSIRDLPLVDDIIDAILWALNTQLDICNSCEVQCLSQPHSACDFFDTGPLPMVFRDEDRSYEDFLKLFIDSLIEQVSPSTPVPKRHSRKKSSKKRINQPQVIDTQFSENPTIPLEALPSSIQPTPPVNSAPQIFQLKVTLRDLRPPVWRRLLIRDTATFAELHTAIQEYFGWAGYHLHNFTLSKSPSHPSEIRITGLPPDGDINTFTELGVSGDYREDQVHLRDLLSLNAPRAVYTYDFGDNWDHLIILEEILPLNPTLSYPKCVKAKGVCPPEDSGGPWAYMEDRVEGGLEGDEDWSYMEENLEPRDQSSRNVMLTQKSKRTKKQTTISPKVLRNSS